MIINIIAIDANGDVNLDATPSYRSELDHHPLPPPPPAMDMDDYKQLDNDVSSSPTRAQTDPFTNPYHRLLEDQPTELSPNPATRNSIVEGPESEPVMESQQQPVKDTVKIDMTKEVLSSTITDDTWPTFIDLHPLHAGHDMKSTDENLGDNDGRQSAPLSPHPALSNGQAEKPYLATAETSVNEHIVENSNTLDEEVDAGYEDQGCYLASRKRSMSQAFPSKESEAPRKTVKHLFDYLSLSRSDPEESRNLSSRRREMEKELQMIYQELSDIQGRVKAKEEHLKDLQTQLTDTQENVKEKEDRILALQTDLRDKDGELTCARSAMSTLQEQFEIAQEYSRNQENDVSDLTKQIKALHKKYKSTKYIMDQMKRLYPTRIRTCEIVVGWMHAFRTYFASIEQVEVIDLEKDWVEVCQNLQELRDPVQKYVEYGKSLLQSLQHGHNNSEHEDGIKTSTPPILSSMEE